VLLDKKVDEVGCGDDGYGWNDFVLTSSEEKRRYMAVQLYESCREKIGDEAALLLVNAETGVRISCDAYVDHQSELCFPVDRKTGFVDLNFFREFMDAVLQTRVAILGGNDNDSKPYEWASYGEHVFTEMLTDSRSQLWARKDPVYGTWTLYDSLNGNKIRLSLDDKPDPERSSLPELVDLKITDYCNQGCKYCYQGSSMDGKHSRDINSILWALEKIGVFEVAIGGGEPTLHPKFSDILQRVNWCNMTANFSTRKLSWMNNIETRSKVLDNSGTFAFSIENRNGVSQLNEALHGVDVVKKPNIQVIPEIISKYEFEAILREACRNRIGVTLLGFKETGRGGEYLQDKWTQKSDEWLGVIKGLYDKEWLPKLGFDTVLAAKHQETLEGMGVPSYMYYTTEGTFSMYIDAVNMVCGPSSFCSKSELVKLPDKGGTGDLVACILKAFIGWQEDRDA
jgi:hypothetical protein